MSQTVTPIVSPVDWTPNNTSYPFTSCTFTGTGVTASIIPANTDISITVAGEFYNDGSSYTQLYIYTSPLTAFENLNTNTKLYTPLTPETSVIITSLSSTIPQQFSAGTYYLYVVLDENFIYQNYVQFTVASGGGGGGGGGGTYNLTAVITSSTLFPSWTPANTATVTSDVNGIVSQSPFNIPPANVNLRSITSGSTILTYFITGFNTAEDANNALLLLQQLTWPPNLNIISVTGTESGGNAISNICFPAGTPVQTDQGMVPIERLQPTQHTLAGQAIQHVTQTVTLDPYLICIEPHALGRHYPTAKTILTKDHLVLYKGQMVPAERLLRVSPQVTKVKYSGEVLYNVLLADHSTMRVNNLVCETLHPDNAIAQLYNSPFSAAYKSNLIAVMNDSLLKKDAAAYKNIVNRLTM